MRRHFLFSALVVLSLAACSPAPAPDAASPPAPTETAPAPTETAPAPTTTDAAPTADAPPAGSTTIVVSQDPCKTDDDCAPTTCCIGTACGAASKAPDCSAVRCRRDCSKPTIECGGGCLCQNGFCAAKLGTTPE